MLFTRQPDFQFPFGTLLPLARRCLSQKVHISIIPRHLRFLCFHTLTHSFALLNSLSSIFSGVSALFAKNTRGGVSMPEEHHRLELAKQVSFQGSEESALAFSPWTMGHGTRATFLAHPINFSKYSFAPRTSSICFSPEISRSIVTAPGYFISFNRAIILGKSTFPFPIATSSPNSFGFVGQSPSFA